MPTLRELRETHGWTQTELAKRVGVNRSTVARWETAAEWQNLPSRMAMIALGRLFGVDPDVIVFGSDEIRKAGKPRRKEDDHGE